MQGSREKAGPGGEEQDLAGGQEQAGRGKNLAGSAPEWGAVKEQVTADNKEQASLDQVWRSQGTCAGWTK